MTELTEKHLDDIASTLEGIATDLRECGVDEWGNLEDCLMATRANVDADLQSIDEEDE